MKIDAGNYTTQTSPYTFTGLASGSHTITVKDANGCTKSASISVDSCVGYCALTQGAYGSPGGIFSSPTSCYNGLGTLDLIKALLGDTSIRNCGLPNPDPLIVGIVGHEVADDSIERCAMHHEQTAGERNCGRIAQRLWRPNAPEFAQLSGSRSKASYD